MPKVSVIIPTYNCARFLKEALESVSAQTYHDYEIIVIDDGSTDNTAGVVEAYSQKCAGRLRYLKQDNQGICFARNHGIRAMQGEYVAFLDSDDRWEPDRLREGVRVLDNAPDTGLVYSNIRRIREDGSTIGVPAVDRDVMSGNIFEPLFLRRANIITSSVLLRRSCLDVTGLFDEKMTRMGAEDRDLWLRIAQKFRIRHIDKVLVEYRVRGQSLSRNYEKMMEGRIYIINKFFPVESGYNRLRNTALAVIYKELGDTYLFEGQFAKSRASYLKSLKFQPFSVWPMVNFLKALLHVKVEKRPVW